MPRRDRPPSFASGRPGPGGDCVRSRQRIRHEPAQPAREVTPEKHLDALASVLARKVVRDEPRVEPSYPRSDARRKPGLDRLRELVAIPPRQTHDRVGDLGWDEHFFRGLLVRYTECRDPQQVRQDPNLRRQPRLRSPGRLPAGVVAVEAKAGNDLDSVGRAPDDVGIEASFHIGVRGANDALVVVHGEPGDADVRPRAHERAIGHPLLDLGSDPTARPLECRARPRAGVGLQCGQRVVVAERARDAHVPTVSERVVVAQVRPVILDMKRRRSLVRELVVGAEDEERKGVSVGHSMRDAELVIPISNLVVRNDQRCEKVGVRVPAGGENRPSTAVERRLDERVRVEHACARLAPRLVFSGRRRLPGDEGARVSAIASRIGARKQIDRVDEGGRDRRRPRPDVEEQRHTNSVDRVANGLRRRAADVVVGKAAEIRSHPRQRLDDAERIAEGARYELRLGAGDVVGPELLALTLHRNVDRWLGLRRGRRRRDRWLPRLRLDPRSSGRGLRRGGAKRDGHGDPSRDRRFVSRRRSEAPRLDGGRRGVSEGGRSLPNPNVGDHPDGVDDDRQIHRGVAVALRRVRHGGDVEATRRNDIGGRTGSTQRRERQRRGAHHGKRPPSELAERRRHGAA